MRTLLYFHGYGSNIERSLSNRSIVDAISDEVIAFNAPFSAEWEDSFKWFSLPDDMRVNDDAARQVKQSCAFIKDKLRENNIDESELTLFGNSQGAFMALYLTLNNIIVPKKTIAVVPFYPRELVNENINTKTPILWVNAGRDERITGDVKETWKDLQKFGAKIDFILDPESEHGVWTEQMVNKIIKWGK
jgi:predicted esterase